jgi:hypothetical protein
MSRLRVISGSVPELLRLYPARFADRGVQTIDGARGTPLQTLLDVIAEVTLPKRRWSRPLTRPFRGVVIMRGGNRNRGRVSTRAGTGRESSEAGT